MGSVIDISNKTFGRLTVIKENPIRNKENRVLWDCKCTCGNTTTVSGTNLRRGVTKSCGCLRIDINTTHNKRSHPLYYRHKGMLDRCYNMNSKPYPNYGGRGITVCDEWLNSFENFYNDMIKGWGDKLHLDRIDNDRGYSKKNCRWTTSAQNQRNRRGEKGTSSKYKGVHWDKKSGKWKSLLRKDNKSIFIGYFLDEEKAALAYNKKAFEINGEYAYMNVIED